MFYIAYKTLTLIYLKITFFENEPYLGKHLKKYCFDYTQKIVAQIVISFWRSRKIFLYSFNTFKNICRRSSSSNYYTNFVVLVD